MGRVHRSGGNFLPRPPLGPSHGKRRLTRAEKRKAAELRRLIGDPAARRERFGPVDPGEDSRIVSALQRQLSRIGQGPPITSWPDGSSRRQAPARSEGTRSVSTGTESEESDSSPSPDDASCATVPADIDAGPNRVPVGVLYRIPTLYESTELKRTLEFDFEAMERGSRGHVATETALVDALCALGVAPLSPSHTDPRFDVAWVDKDVLYVAEIKSTTNANFERQLRLGLGQVLRYRELLLTVYDRVRAVLVPECEPPDATWLETCSSVGVTLLPCRSLLSRLTTLMSDDQGASEVVH